MSTVSRRALLASLFVLPTSRFAGADPLDGWVPLFDGRSLSGWKTSQPDSWKVVDGAIVADGPRSHLFYTGPVSKGVFKNFEFEAEVMTSGAANSGIFFHTQFQDDGWPAKGFQAEINSTSEVQKTGSLFSVRHVCKQTVRDNEWFKFYVGVRGNRVWVRVNDTLLVDYVEPQPPLDGRVLGSGTFALQCHDPASKVRFRNVRVRPLLDYISSPSAEAPEVDAVYRQIRSLTARNYPVVDYHVHLKGGWTIEDALKESRRLGIQYGIAVNCGKGFGVTGDAGIRAFLDTMKGEPVFIAMQAEGREWVKMFSPDAVAQFDYVFTDAMTFFDDDGRRMRLWIKEEVGDIPDHERFMETIVSRTVGVLNNEPVDIYVNPTFLPDVMAPEYDKLWTPERMDRVIEAAKRNGIAIEINNRYRIPSAAFLKRAKTAGCKFSFGTNNADPKIGRLEYPLAMVEECGIGPDDIFVPKAPGKKPVQLKGFRS